MDIYAYEQITEKLEEIKMDLDTIKNKLGIEDMEDITEDENTKPEDVEDEFN